MPRSGELAAHFSFHADRKQAQRTWETFAPIFGDSDCLTPTPVHLYGSGECHPRSIEHRPFIYWEFRFTFMQDSDSRRRRKVEKFSPGIFLATVVATLGGLGVALKFAAPSLWQAQLDAPLWAFAAAFLAFSLFYGFVEFFFHRYVLHRPVLRGLGYFYRQHTLHHSLTRIARRTTPGGRDVAFVENRFPMTTPEQDEASFFPWYSLAVFSLLIAPVLFALQVWTLDGYPWFFAGFSALASSLTLYEMLHAIEHWPFEKWAPLIEHPRWGWFWRKAYSFHLRHHAVIDCNEAISGFFGLPIADWVFGTYTLPRTLYVTGSDATTDDFARPRPFAFIRWCDRYADQIVSERRARKAAAVAESSEPSYPGKKYKKERIYSCGEELAHALTHGLGMVGAAVGLVLLVLFSVARGDAWHIVSFTIFGVTLLLLYAASTVYHSVRAERWKHWLQKLDHAAIFLLIAGTYTPFLLAELRNPLGWTLLGIVWGLCTAGAVFQLFLAGRFRIATTLAYVFLGWLVVIAVKPLLAVVPSGAMWLLLAGGLSYTVGVVFYLWRRLRYNHAVWHTFVLGGSTCHFLAVLLLVMPNAGGPG